MVRPFEVHPPLLDLPSHFPDPDEVRGALTDSTRRAREIFARLWLTEGVPSVFQHCPAVYEEIRGWLSGKLNVHPKEISLVGSARIGYSLAPPPNFGREFNENSDLDLTAISFSLFDVLVRASNSFSKDFSSGEVSPRSDYERSLWEENIRFYGRNIPRGFLDSWKIPNFDRYPDVQKINSAMSSLCARLKVTPGAPAPKRASIRVYREWECFIDQVTLNLRNSLAARQSASSTPEEAIVG